MNTSQAEQLGQAIVAVCPRQMGAIPLVYPILTDLQVQQTTNDLVPSQADIDMGREMVLLTLNRLLAPQPLYHVADWLLEGLEQGFFPGGRRGLGFGGRWGNPRPPESE